MAKALVAFYSRTGNTKKMAEAIAEAMVKNGVPTDLRKVESVAVPELLSYDAIVLGSPTYYGTMSWEVKKLLDESVKFHGKLRGRVGGAFTSSGNIAGGNETTVLDILRGLMIHGMVVQGDEHGDHYGPVAVGKPDQRSLRSCERYGQRLAGLVKKLVPESKP
jgi:NAD(P)H dehydrogenase (quinone)